MGDHPGANHPNVVSFAGSTFLSAICPRHTAKEQICPIVLDPKPLTPQSLKPQILKPKDLNSKPQSYTSNLKQRRNDKPKTLIKPLNPKPWYPPLIMENQMEKIMENEMETGFI